MNQIRRWTIPFLLFLFLLWLVSPEPQKFLMSIGASITFGVVAYIVWWQLNYTWRIIFALVTAGLAIAFVGGGMMAFIFSIWLGFPLLPVAIIAGLVTISIVTALFLFPVYLAATRRIRQGEHYMTYLLKLFPNNLMYLAWRGAARQDLLDYEGALSDYRKGIQIGINKKKQNDQLAQMYTNRAVILLERGHIDAAIKDINHAFDIKSDFAMAYRVHADILVEVGDLKGAFESAEHALSLNRKDILSFIKYADVLTQMKRKDEAVKAIRDAQKTMPNEMALYTSLTSILIQLESYEEALSVADEGLSRTNDALLQAMLRHNRRVAYRYLGNYEKAQDEYETLGNIQFPAPFDRVIRCYAYNEQGIIHFLQQDYHQSQTDFAHAFDANALSTLSLLGLAAAQYANGEIEAAYETWKRFWAIPSHFHNLERLRRERHLTEGMFDLLDRIADERPAEIWQTRPQVDNVSKQSSVH